MNRKKTSLFDKSIWILLIWTVFQDFALGLIYHYTNNPTITKLLFHSKDVMMVLLYMCSFFKLKMTRYNAFVQFSYVLIVFLQVIPAFLQEEYSVASILASTRALLLLPTFYFIGYSIKNKERFRENVKNRYFPFLAFVAFVGILEYVADMLVGTKDFWINVVQIGKFQADIKGQEGRLYMGLPGNFYTSSSKGVFTLKRLVSFWGVPLASGYCLLIPCLYYFFSWMNKRKNILCSKHSQKKEALLLAILLIAIILTVTRAIIFPLSVVLILAILSAQKKHRCNVIIICGTGALFLTLFLLSKFDQIIAYVYNGSTIGHIEALSSSLGALNLFGQGVASFGIEGSIGTESTYVAVWGQLGLAGVLLYLYILVYPIQRGLKVYKRACPKDMLLITMVLASAVYAFTGIISEQLTAYTTIVPFYILLGCETGYWDERQKRIYNTKSGITPNTMIHMQTNILSE